MLDASGLLFNVEDAMNFFLIDEVLATLAAAGQRRGKDVRVTGGGQCQGKDVRVWAAGIYPSCAPRGFVSRVLRRCVRCPPTVQRVLEHVEKDISVSGIDR